MTFTQLWHRAFLDKRPSLSLGLFRIAVAITIGCHIIPSFFHMEENYLPMAFKVKNFSLFTVPFLRLVDASPPWLIWAFTALFFVSLLTFAFGWHSRLSCILLTISCYYFDALNSFHIGTLSFDILLVTLFLMCATGFHGDFLSWDSLRHPKETSYKQLRPFFLQRLLQLQLAWTFWYTALGKITAGGNWLIGNPYYALMHYPSIGVVREFPLRSFLSQHPMLCYDLGIACILFEIALPFLLFIRRTRLVGIVLGTAFQIMLWLTLHVPTIFLFLFPPMMLLFIAPEDLVRWIEERQQLQAKQGRAILLYDGHCGFCAASVKRLRVLDLFGWVDPLDFHVQPNLAALHPTLTPERCQREMVLVEPDGTLSGGFDAFRRMCIHVPLLWPFAPLVHLPGSRQIGTRFYQWIANHRSCTHHDHCSAVPVDNGSAFSSREPS